MSVDAHFDHGTKFKYRPGPVLTLRSLFSKRKSFLLVMKYPGWELGRPVHVMILLDDDQYSS
jgi:hypothetical protein